MTAPTPRFPTSPPPLKLGGTIRQPVVCALRDAHDRRDSRQCVVALLIARGTNVEDEDKVRLHAERERHLGVAPAQGHDAPQGLLDGDVTELGGHCDRIGRGVAVSRCLLRQRCRRCRHRVVGRTGIGVRRACGRTPADKGERQEYRGRATSAGSPQRHKRPVELRKDSLPNIR